MTKSATPGMYHKVYRTRRLNAKEKVKYVIWTNEMDRYLSKILVELVKKENKFDSIIKPATYAAAVDALNEKFGLELTKDHLKHRLKTLRKQYGSVKEILAQKGFKWDKARKMVVADDAVWNNYIKAHPDAKLLRAKFIENYEDLCIIVGNDQSIPNCSDNDAEANVDLISDDETVTMSARNLRWTEEMDLCLGEILVEEVKKGHKIDNIIQPEAYNTALTVLNRKFGPSLTKDHIRNRLKTWKKQYGVLKELLSNIGFEWDETQKMIIGDDSAWVDFIKTHTHHEAQLFRGRVVENYDHLCVIFGNNHVTGSYSRTANDIVHSLVVDSKGVEAIDASPIRCYGLVKCQGKNIMWTDEMDRYLSMILVEQVKLGNKSKLDNKFTSVAYVAAVSALRERFQLNFTKDQVRNRIKIWKKLYGSVKELLDQSAFKWDEKRKMVTANEYAWHDYTKRNPEAGLLQGRVIENYDELCVIIGNDNPTESLKTDSEADLDWAAEIEGTETEFASQNHGDNSRDRGKYILWTDEMDRCLTEKLIEQVKLGNKLGKVITPVAYKAAVNALNENFALDVSKENIKSRLKTWKKLYGLAKELLSHGGFVWDEERKMVVAADSIWNEYIKTHPDAKYVWGRSIENYDELRVIIDNDHGTGCYTNPTYNNEERVETPLVNVLVDEGLSEEDNTDDAMEGSSEQTRARPSSSSQSKRPIKKRRGNDIMVEMMSAVAANIGRIADALTASNQSVCLDELFEMVQNIPGFDDDLIIEACEFLSFDEKRAKMFLKLDERLRKLWLLKRLRGQSS